MAKKKTETIKKLRLTYVHSAIGYSIRHKATISAIGFHRLHETLEKVDTPSLRGMLAKVAHLVEIEEQVEQ